MFPRAHTTPSFANPGRACAPEIWREAASEAATRWQSVLDAEPENRAFAFASHVAALDAEEAAAADIAALASSDAA